jgi:hypothetical protein
MSLISTITSPEQGLDAAQTGKILQVLIRNREKVIYDGQALALSSVNSKGTFDILGQHINFISIIKDYIKIHKTDRTIQEYKLRTGLMKVNGNKIEIFVGISDLPAFDAASPDDLAKVKPARRDILGRLAKVLPHSEEKQNPVV